MESSLIPIELFAKVTYSVIPAKAGIQNCLKILDSGSRFALNTMRCRASLARNDDFILLSRVLQKARFFPFLHGFRKDSTGGNSACQFSQHRWWILTCPKEYSFALLSLSGKITTHFF
jgi:hypothetical protein